MQEYTVKVFEDKTEWYQNGKLHRMDGPAVEWNNGDKYWYQNGQSHRTDGPAIEFHNNGTKYWYQNNQLHRLDGPAVEYKNSYKCWFIKGKEYSESEFNAFVNKKDNCDGKIVEIDGKKYKLNPIK